MARAGRVILATEAVNATPVVSVNEARLQPTPSERVVPAVLVAAEQKAQALLAQAVARAEQEYARRVSEFEASAHARLAEVERACRLREAECALRETIERNATERYQKDALMGFACLLAERLLGEQLRLTPETILALTCEVLREARGAKQLGIIASPVDATILLSIAPSLAELFQATVEVRSDPSLSSGDLIIESELGRTEARLKSRLDCLVDLLKQSERT